jgi:hypothetical protein
MTNQNTLNIWENKPEIQRTYNNHEYNDLYNLISAYLVFISGNLTKIQNKVKHFDLSNKYQDLQNYNSQPLNIYDKRYAYEYFCFEQRLIVMFCVIFIKMEC